MSQAASQYCKQRHKNMRTLNNVAQSLKVPCCLLWCDVLTGVVNYTKGLIVSVSPHKGFDG
jgi:hypothetical protein